jgi:hypothetical protein
MGVAQDDELTLGGSSGSSGHRKEVHDGGVSTSSFGDDGGRPPVERWLRGTLLRWRWILGKLLQ